MDKKLKAISPDEWRVFVARQVEREVSEAILLDIPNAEVPHPEQWEYAEYEPEDYGFYIDYSLCEEIPF